MVHEYNQNSWGNWHSAEGQHQSEWPEQNERLLVNSQFLGPSSLICSARTCNYLVLSVLNDSQSPGKMTFYPDFFLSVSLFLLQQIRWWEKGEITTFSGKLPSYNRLLISVLRIECSLFLHWMFQIHSVVNTQSVTGKLHTGFLSVRLLAALQLSAGFRF